MLTMYMIIAALMLLAINPPALSFERIGRLGKPKKAKKKQNPNLMFKSGGDGGAAQMRADEEARQARINASVAEINNVFGGRQQKQYDDLGAAVTATNVRDLDKQFTRASKENKYGLARIGQLGGSVAADSEGDLQERYGEGKIRATALGSDAAANLKISDEKTRQNLISLAQSGLDTGVASNMATQQLSAAQQAASAGANTATIGNLFEGLTQAYIRNQQGQLRPAPLQTNPYGGSANLWGSGSVGYYMK